MAEEGLLGNDPVGMDVDQDRPESEPEPSTSGRARSRGRGRGRGRRRGRGGVRRVRRLGADGFRWVVEQQSEQSDNEADDSLPGPVRPQRDVAVAALQQQMSVMQEQLRQLVEMQVQQQQQQLAVAQPVVQHVAQPRVQPDVPHAPTQNSDLVALAQFLRKKDNKMRLPDYDGTTCYAVFQAQFARAAQSGEWTDQEKSDRLLQAVKGDATRAVSVITTQKAELSFANLDTMLAKMFITSKTLWERQRVFESQRQQPEQSLRDFARVVETTGREYMVSHDEAAIQDALVRIFLRGILDSRSAEMCAYTNVSTLEDAIGVLERGKTLREAREPPKKVRRVEVETDPTAPAEAAVSHVSTNQSTPGTSVSDQSSSASGTQTGGRGSRGGRGGRGYRGGRGGRGRGSYGSYNSGGATGTACVHCGLSNHRSDDCFTQRRGSSGRDLSRVQCHRCQEFGHYQSDCTNGPQRHRAHQAPSTSTGVVFPAEALQAATAFYRFNQALTNMSQNDRSQPQATASTTVVPYVPGNQGQGNS